MSPAVLALNEPAVPTVKPGGGLSYHPEAPSASMIHASAQRVQRRDLDHRSEFEPVACLKVPEPPRCRAVCRADGAASTSGTGECGTASSSRSG